jgi:hypothetical protein
MLTRAELVRRRKRINRQIQELLLQRRLTRRPPAEPVEPRLEASEEAA